SPRRMRRRRRLVPTMGDRSAEAEGWASSGDGRLATTGPRFRPISRTLFMGKVSVIADALSRRSFLRESGGPIGAAGRARRGYLVRHVCKDRAPPSRRGAARPQRRHVRPAASLRERRADAAALAGGPASRPIRHGLFLGRRENVLEAP